MKKELTKEQNTIINDLLFSEFIKICQLKGEAEKNKYLDKTQIETQLYKIQELMNFFNED